MEDAKVAADAVGPRRVPGGSCSPSSIDTVPPSTRASECGSGQVSREDGTPKAALKHVAFNVTSTSPRAEEAPFFAATPVAMHGTQRTQGLSPTDLQGHKGFHTVDAESPHPRCGFPIKSLFMTRSTRISIPSHHSHNTSQTQLSTAVPTTAGDAISDAVDDAPELVGAESSPSHSSAPLPLTPPATTPCRLSCLSRSAATVSAATSASEVPERHYSDSRAPAEPFASSSRAAPAAAVASVAHAADFDIHRDSHAREAALLRSVVQEGDQTTSNSLDGALPPPHLLTQVHRTLTSAAGLTGDSTGFSSAQPLFSSSAVDAAAQRAQTRMEANHARSQRPSRTSELSARHHPRASSFVDASLSSAPSPLLTQLLPQRAQATPRSSVYRDIHDAPEGMSGRSAPLPRRGLRVPGGSAHPTYTTAVATVTDAIGVGDRGGEDVLGQREVALSSADPPFLHRDLVENTASCSPAVAAAAEFGMPTEAEVARRVPATTEPSIASCVSTSPVSLTASQHPTSLIPYSTESPSRSALVSPEGSCVLAAPPLVLPTTLPPTAPSCGESAKALLTAPRTSACGDCQIVNGGGGALHLDGGQAANELPYSGGAVSCAECCNTFAGVVSDTIRLAPMLADTLPHGRCFTLNMLTTWGDAHEVGLCGLELFDDRGQRLLPCCVAATGTTAVVSQTASEEGDVVILAATTPNGFVCAFAEYTATETNLAAASNTAATGGEDAAQVGPSDDAVCGDPRRQLRTLIYPHPLNTHDETHMFAVPYTAGKPHLVSFVFAEPVRLSVMRLHNYAGRGRVHTTKGVRIAEAWMEATMVFRGEVRANSGELCRGESAEEAEDGVAHGQGDQHASRPSSLPPSTSFSPYGLENCENVLWTTDAAVLARVMAHGPPSTTPPLREVDDSDGTHGRRRTAGVSVEGGAAVPRCLAPTSTARDDLLSGDPAPCRRVSARPSTTTRRSRAPPVRFSFCSARQADAAMPRHRRASAGGAPRLRGDKDTVTSLQVCPDRFPRPSGAVEAWADVATDARVHQMPAGSTTDSAQPELHNGPGQDDRQLRKQRRRHLNRQSVLDPARCPRRVTAICVMVLSTWGATQHVGLSCLRLRDASGDVVGSVDVQCAALHYPDGTSSVCASHSCRGSSAAGTVENRHHAPSAACNNDDSNGSVKVQGDVDCGGECRLSRSVRGLLHSEAYSEEAARGVNQQDCPSGPCLLPFQSTMQLVFIFRDPISSLGFLDVANYSVGDQTGCGVKDARVFFAEEAEEGATAATSPRPSAEVFRQLWYVGASSQSRHALAAARVYEVTPSAGVTLRKAPAFLDSARFQSYDVSLYGPGLPPPRIAFPPTPTVRDDDTATAATAAAPAATAILDAQLPRSNLQRALPPSTHDTGMPFADHLGRYEIASGPGTGGAGSSSIETEVFSISGMNLNGEGGQPCAQRHHGRASSFSLTSSLGASMNIRANVAMHRARMSLLQERPAWLLEYQPYVTPLLPVGYVCKLRLTVCARDVPAAEPLDPSAGCRAGAKEAKPPYTSAAATSSLATASVVGEAPAQVATVITAGDSLKAYLKEWLVKPLRACSFVNERGDVVKPMRPDKYRAMMHDEAARRHSTSWQDGNDDGDAQHERALARCVPMVAESMVSVVPANRHNSAASTHAMSLPQPPLQVVAELLYVADVPFCISLVALHKPLVVCGSAAWVRQVQVFVDDALVFSSGEASVRLTQTSSGNGAARDPGVGAGARAGDATGPAASGSFGPQLNNGRGGAADAASEGAQLWGDLPECATSLKPYVVFTLDPDLLGDLRAEATGASSSS
ncbi:conserved hypothetical protein [Leishmania major strain Friedlin]|uniref:KATNIP domain-containing protein n=1 Tax=Leishmania major TaxID=5664 RepID=Q4Q8Z9_LEIMA|nr:conserved hypothetical protein [Leishmania major strain Friedlin]CAG9576518.1 Domain_of_unknown_function_(DUF4457)_-_putative [Leishmania major strain Friedlin]CAJ05472.1 conserved hypothetical protein [Leishmania major strain Friedlin]|eukprot:XP_001684199.1 conserved hypothetical protein [Leishmania major strain Friedlin]